MSAQSPRSSARLEPAEIESFDGSLRSTKFGDIYHSGAGALAQAHHVFLGGNGLPERFSRAARFTILEAGFGLGLNFLATWQAWRAAAPAEARLDYLAVEKHPARAEDLARVMRGFPELAGESQELIARWPWLMSGVYRLEFEGGRIALTLAWGDALDALREFRAGVDAVYLDGFAPATNREMWSAALFAEVARLTRPGATLATYTVAAVVREGLSQAGFEVVKRAGLPPKREMLVAAKPGLWLPRALRPEDALVIGCGLAGALTAERLARRGYSVTVLERHDAPATETSGNLAGLLLPALNPADTASAKLSRAAFGFALNQIAGLAQNDPGVSWGQCGVLQVAALDEEVGKMAEIVASHGVPSELARLVSREEAARLAGGPVPRGGFWYERGAWLRPATLIAAVLRRAGTKIGVRLHQPVARLARDGDHWVALDEAGLVLARAGLVVLATGNGLEVFAQARGIAIIPARGQHSYLPQALRPLPVAVCGDGYAVPLPDGRLMLGTTFDRDAEPALRVSDHEKNLTRVAALLPGLVPEVDAATLDGRVAFRATSPDRLPYVGLLPEWDTQRPEVVRQPGLAIINGLGARGLVWAPLTAEYLACLLADDPWPLASSLATAIDPARIVLRRKRKPGALAP
ncbi:MAG: bifunctional tRNA (5-methylaminomethyl-2-thiouridine)(34)-methyltransferase MnmD/FAD-dependent 5-carboxymethylaminomethyl-2-thiouridine(34) oxidoreductase MnmC [Betaproteobacteria bacterium]|nr:bifunctional tRNA (5-methylaminomethyl-2-thiouridine)(34)-methyltransferase MnmD/FAD-dependent 5-carboxymethylaminomethyl-2-thiouridine(34) oxidoreductase MnmC [Betaproteobacteria bacterium]